MYPGWIYLQRLTGGPVVTLATTWLWSRSKLPTWQPCAPPEASQGWRQRWSAPASVHVWLFERGQRGEPTGGRWQRQRRWLRLRSYPGESVFGLGRGVVMVLGWCWAVAARFGLVSPFSSLFFFCFQFHFWILIWIQFCLQMFLPILIRT
jgi:hypothetical protein